MQTTGRRRSAVWLFSSLASVGGSLITAPDTLRLQHTP